MQVSLAANKRKRDEGIREEMRYLTMDEMKQAEGRAFMQEMLANFFVAMTCGLYTYGSNGVESNYYNTVTAYKDK
jgi:hypothetical protein